MPRGPLTSKTAEHSRLMPRANVDLPATLAPKEISLFPEYSETSHPASVFRVTLHPLVSRAGSQCRAERQTLSLSLSLSHKGETLTRFPCCIRATFSISNRNCSKPGNIVARESFIELCIQFARRDLIMMEIIHKNSQMATVLEYICVKSRKLGALLLSERSSPVRDW